MNYTIKVLTSLFVILFLLAGCEGDEPTPENIAAHLNGTEAPSANETSTTEDPVITTVEEVISFDVAIADSEGVETLNVVTGSPVVVSATLLIDEQPQAGVLVAFSMQYNLGVLDPVIGTVLTNENGVAAIILSAGDQAGADTITATGGGLSANMNFSVSAETTNVSMSAATASPVSISATGTSTVNVTINDVDNATSYNEPVAVNFTSVCVQAGLATIESPVVSVNGTVTSTYKDIACGQADTVEVNTKVGSQLLSSSVVIDVQDATAGSINFIGASNEFIALQGTGGSGGGVTRSETSVLTFQVLDVTGNPAAYEEVMFELSSQVGNISLNYESAQTNGDGFVDIIVQSGHVASTIRVIATLASNTDLSTVSDLLVISSGVADQNSFSLSVSNFNPEGWTIDGLKVAVNAYAADHFNNPVPDGTAIAFTTEFGQIEPACTTVNGSCSVNWTSSNPRTPIPEFRDDTTVTRWLGDGTACLSGLGVDTGFNSPLFAFPCFYSNATAATVNTATNPGGLGQVYGNRISILAHLMGEESFADSNGNGVFDAGEAYNDIAAEAFRDDNEDGVFAGRSADGELAAGAQTAIDACESASGVTCLQAGGDNEEYVDFNNDGVYQSSGNQLLNSVLCQDEGNGCTKQLLPIWQNITILQAGSFAHISVIESTLDHNDRADYFNTVSLTSGTKSVTAYVADLHNGRMPSGTQISFTTSGAGTIVGPSSCTVLNTSAYGFEGCSVAIKEDPENEDAVNGPLIIKVVTPGGFITETSIMITDDADPDAPPAP
ncbi:hypothetical protein RGQ13_05425 [Thalassotalea psychrophila]|uniref:Big-1 domain-containing protein n=1 Tax=Thalassotalea psychrophila TaxID=3065647 RepID=A0ABY9TXD6_9GAMM|nr:hypothetical protein RGQ13_05425 [Colwelliaceae bacterium SQ149]